MVIAAIIVGIFLILLFFITEYLSSKKGSDFENGTTMGAILSLCFIIEVILLTNAFETPSPTAMDVYQGKTTLEYKVVDGVKIDSIVILKNNNYGKEN